MPRFLHDLPEAKGIFEILAAERHIPEEMVEKDYWIMHCLWGLQKNKLYFEMKGGSSLSKGWKCIDRFSEDIDIRFEPTKEIKHRGDSKASIESRLAFYNDIAGKIQIPGVKVARNLHYDDDKARNGGISLIYKSHFSALPGLKQEVLLEVGFAHTTPNEPMDFSSWALERVLESGDDVVDTRARSIPCYNPEYTFVEKLQTICRRFRQYRDRKDPTKDQPGKFLRHYYDLFRLMEVDRVKTFIGSSEYIACKKDRIRGADAVEFESKEAFKILDNATYKKFAEGYESMKALWISPGPTFAEMMERIRDNNARF